MNENLLIADSDFLSHSSHKYIERKMGKNGKWIYVYNRPKKGQSLIDKREANRQVTAKNLSKFGLSVMKARSPIVAGYYVAQGISDKNIKKKEDHIKELETQLAEAKDKGYYDDGNANSAYKTTSDIEKELAEARADLEKEKTKLVAKHSYIEGKGYFITPTNSDIKHHGVEGMSWGQRNGPPYPLNSSGKSALQAQKKAKKAAAKIAKQVEREDKKEKSKEEKKQEAIRKHSYQELYKMKDQLSYNDIQNAMNRIKLEQDLYSKAYPPTKSTWDKIDSAMNGVGKLTSWTNTGINAYNTFAKIYNSSEYGQKNPWKTIGGKGGEDKKKK